MTSAMQSASRALARFYGERTLRGPPRRAVDRETTEALAAAEARVESLDAEVVRLRARLVAVSARLARHEPPTEAP